MNNIYYPLLYFLFIFIGFFLAFLYGRHCKKFLWKEYAALLFAPYLGVLLLSFLLGIKVIYVVISGSLIGPALEWFVGFFYHKTLGSRLWIYERYPLPGRYTSYLTIPLWGFALLLLYLIAREF